MRLIFIIGFLWACATTQAQTLLPPVWQSDTQKEVQVSTRTISWLWMPETKWHYAEYQSAAGLIKSVWRYEGDQWIWDFTIPQGATASVTLPGETEAKEYTAGSYQIVK